MSKEVLFLTGRHGENTGEIGAKRMMGLGLKYQTHKGFHPLVQAEARFVSKAVSRKNGGPSIRFGHAVLHRGKKWISPAAEFRYSGVRGMPQVTAKRRARALASAIHAAAVAAEAMDIVGGKTMVLLDHEAETHILLIMALPEKIAGKFGDFAEWRRFVEGCLR